jgi:hypothetical protein
LKILKYILAIPLLFVGLWIVAMALYAAVLVGAGLVGGAYEYVFGSERDRMATSHLTIYVDPAVQADGGVTTVVGMPIDEKQWQAINGNRSAAMLDPTNPKAKQVKPIDKHFGVTLASSASVVELYHPKNGTFTYNFLPLPSSTSSKVSSSPALSLPKTDKLGALQTKVISAGSASRMPDPETGQPIDYPSLQIISIAGAKYNESWARMAEYNFSNVKDEDKPLAYKITKSPGVRAIEMTPFGLEKYFNTVSKETNK